MNLFRVEMEKCRQRDSMWSLGYLWSWISECIRCPDNQHSHNFPRPSFPRPWTSIFQWLSRLLFYFFIFSIFDELSTGDIRENLPSSYLFTSFLAWAFFLPYPSGNWDVENGKFLECWKFFLKHKRTVSIRSKFWIERWRIAFIVSKEASGRFGCLR